MARYASLGIGQVERALRMLSMVRLGIGRTGIYDLGTGGRNPANAHPFTASKEKWASDCIGALCWASGFDRFQGPARFSTYGGWINTNSAIIDARGPKQGFEEIPRWAAEIGDWIVYPSRFFGVGKGHCGMVVKVSPNPISTFRKWTDRLDIAHCSSSAQRRLGYPISLLDCPAFTTRATVLRPKESLTHG